MTKPQPSRPRDRVITSVAERRPALLDVIRRARHRLTLSLFRCNDAEILAALAQAAARGVAVEVLLTSRAKGGRNKRKKLWAALEAMGAAVWAHTDPVVKYHAKYVVADDGPAVVASLNLTRKCFERTCDALVLTYDPGVVTGLRQLMAADRDGLAAPETLSERLIIGPERARRQLTALIVEARTSIRLIDAKVSDPDLVLLLKARRAEGLTVEIFGSKQLGELKSHGKIMLIDDARAIVGSLALAPLSLDFRREVAIVVDDAAAIADVQQLFGAINALPTEGGTGTGDAPGEALC
jgi:phosphatidylserine/phosphatidylglycerophosphate/cardiolipin synthase-like enzyme